MSQYSIKDKEKQRQSVQNESELALIIKQESSLLGTLTESQNMETILARNDIPDYGAGMTLQNNMEKTVGHEEAKTSLQTPSSKRVLPPLKMGSGSNKVLSASPVLSNPKVVEDVPKEFNELEKDEVLESENSQRDFQRELETYTVEQRNTIKNVLSIFKKADVKQLQKQKLSFKVKAKKPFETEMSLNGAPFYFKELDRKFVVYDQRSLGIFDAKGWFRRKVVWIICWPWFDNFIIIMITINSLLLAATDYGDRDNLTPRNQWIEASGLIFTITFTLEAVIKILAMGFCFHNNSYMRDPWNWLDFLVVWIGVIEFIPVIPAANLKAIRTFRVLRPLRSINAFPSMRRLIGSLLASLPSLANAVVFMFFIFLLFGILGVQQFGGVLYQRCRYTSEPNKDPVTGQYTDWPIVEDIDRLCGLNGQGNFKCPEPYFCGSPAQYSLDLKSEVLEDQELISYGIVTFDNLLRALITIFQMITLEGWTDMMYNLSDASQAWMAIFFCVLLVVVGSFFLLNVILAVIMDAFDQVDQNSGAKEAKAKKDLKNLKRFYGVIDSADEFSDEEEKEEESGPEPPITKTPLIEKNVVDMSEINEEQSKGILVSLPDGNFIQDKPANLRAVAPLSLNSSRVKDSEISKKKKSKSKAIEIPQRAQSNKLLKIFFLICTNNAFNIGITLCIIFNTALLAMDRHPIKPETLKVLEQMNGILSWVFFAEMVIKLIGLGIKDYSADSFNLFDCTVVVISIIDLVIAKVGVEFNGGGAISALRAVRLLRVFKLARSWTSFRQLLEKIVITLKDIRNFSVLMLLFMFIYTLLGMELYAYKVIYNNEDLESVASEPGEYPRANFNTFLSGFTTIFIVFIGEDWNSSMYDHVRAKGYGSVFFFISLFILGNLVLLNLFLAILLKNFEEPPGHDEEENEDVDQVSTKQKIKNLMTKCCSCLVKKQDESENVQKREEMEKQRKITILGKTKSMELKDNDKKDGIVVESEYKLHSVQKNQIDKDIFDDGLEQTPMAKAKSQIVNSNSKSKSKSIGRSQTVPLESNKKTFTLASLKKLEVQKSQQPKSKNIPLSGRAFFLMDEHNKFRQFCCKIVSHQYFDSFILTCIGFSTILLTLENPLDDPNGKKYAVLGKIDLVVSIIFFLELLVKVAVYGFMLNGTESYMRNSWNQMDFIIVCFSIVSIVFSGVDLGIIKVLRMLRVLRPLRMISRNPGLRIAVQSLINAIPDIGNVLVVSLLFLLLFAILGTNFYKGTFFSCHTENVPEEFIPLILDKFDCQDFGGEWINVDQNFDNVMNSMITLFNVMTTEGWIDVMWSAVDSNKIDEVPIKNNKSNSVFFFILFMIVGSLFILNMFVGIVINVFNKEKETLQMNHLLTQTQSDWCDVLISCYNSVPVEIFASTGNKYIDLCNKVAMSQTFDTFIFLCIVLNTICLAMSWYDEPKRLAPVLERINLVFNIIYTIEFIIKLIGFGSNYFSDGWNNFDLVIVVAAWLGLIANSIPGLDIGSLTTVIRSFRISRIFKIIKKYKNLRILFYTFIGAIPQLTNVGGLLFLLLFLYSVLGVFLFSEVQLQDALNIHANFQTFGGALITLFRMSTGESWNFIMYDCARVRTITFDCKESQTYEEMQTDGIQGCGSPAKAYPFFISFMVVVSFIFLNLFIAIILESFNTTQDEEQGLQVSQDALGRFKHFWSKLDPKGQGFLPVWQFPQLINMILMEEVKLFHHMTEQLHNGHIDPVDAEKNIYMFNLLQDNQLLSLSANIENYFRAELKLEEKDENEIQIMFEKVMEEVDYEEEELVDELRNLSMSPDERRAMDHKKLVTIDMNKFIGSLQIPCYDKIKYYYYYDILEALSRNLFQNLLSKAQVELFEKEEESARKSTPSSGSESFDDHHEECPVDREYNDDIRDGQLDQILLRLEQKGQKNNIFKYKEMQQLRAKRTMRVQDKLEQFGPDKSIIDSSQVIGAKIIVKYIRLRQERVKLRKLKTQATVIESVGQSDLLETEQVPTIENFKITEEVREQMIIKFDEETVPEQIRVKTVESVEIQAPEQMRMKTAETVEIQIPEQERVKTPEIEDPEPVVVEEPVEVEESEQQRVKTQESDEDKIENIVNFNPVEQEVEMSVSKSASRNNDSPRSGPGNIQGKYRGSEEKMMNGQRYGTYSSTRNRSFIPSPMSIREINQN